MAEKLYKVNEAIEIGYQAPGAKSDLIIKADIYNPSKELISLGVPLQEVGSSGTYRGSFTPTIGGTWQVIMYTEVDSYTRDSQVTKSYSVGLYNLEDVGLAVNALQTALTALGDVATDSDVDAAITAIEGAITALGDVAVQGDVDAAVTALEGYIAALDVATGTDVTNTQTAITNAITAAQGVIMGAITTTQGVITGAIATSQGVITTAISGVQTKCNIIETKIDALDTPAMAF